VFINEFVFNMDKRNGPTQRKFCISQKLRPLKSSAVGESRVFLPEDPRLYSQSILTILRKADKATTEEEVKDILAQWWEAVKTFHR